VRFSILTITFVAAACAATPPPPRSVDALPAFALPMPRSRPGLPRDFPAYDILGRCQARLAGTNATSADYQSCVSEEDLAMDRVLAAWNTVPAREQCRPLPSYQQRAQCLEALPRTPERRSASIFPPTARGGPSPLPIPLVMFAGQYVPVYCVRAHPRIEPALSPANEMLVRRVVCAQLGLPAHGFEPLTPRTTTPPAELRRA
jgi:hypothetical protein